MKKINEFKLIAEIGCNHKGSFEVAKEMIKVAASECKVNIIKFQKRDNKLLLSEKEFISSHPVPENSYGKSYGEHREFLEFNIDQHRQLKKICEDYNADYLSSVWDLVSAREIISLKPKFIKIPSAQNYNLDLLNYVFNNFEGEIFVSLGMTKASETENIVDLSIKAKNNKNLILFHCTSDYPSEFNDLYLQEIKYLKKKYLNIIKDVGFSGHHRGIAVDIAALTLGANYIERHFTLDRTWKGTDHAVSLEPQGLKTLKRNMDHLEKSLKYKTDRENILNSEVFQFNKLKKK